MKPAAGSVSWTVGVYEGYLIFFVEAYAKVCNSAISGLGTDCKALIRLMVTCSHETMDATREAYSRLYGQDLVEAGTVYSPHASFAQLKA